MTILDQVIQQAFNSEGKTEDVNKVYLTMLRTQFFFPVKKDHVATEDEPFAPLFAEVSEKYFLLVFDTVERLTAWAGEVFDQMDYVEITGHDLIAGIAENVYLGVNQGTEFYKEFSPDELKRLKTIVSRIEQMKKGSDDNTYSR